MNRPITQQYPVRQPGLRDPFTTILESGVNEITATMKSVQRIEKQIDKYMPWVVGSLGLIGFGLFAIALTKK